MSTSFSAIVVDRLKRFQGSIAAMTGLVGAGTQSSQGGPGNTAADAAGSTEPSSDQLREQHREMMLRNHRIKVRDYAYESTLPPVRAYHPPRPKGPRPLKRNRHEFESASDEEDDYGMVVLPTVLDELRSRERERESKPAKKPKPLERTPTEPDAESQSQPPTGYSDVSQITPADAALSNVPTDWVYLGRRASSSWTASTCPGSSRDVAGPTGYVDASSEGQSQESEPWVDTPPVTPSISSVPLPTLNATASAAGLDNTSLHRNVTFTPAAYSPPRPPVTAVRRGLSRTTSHNILTPPRLSRAPSLRQVQLARSRSHMSIPRRLSSGSVTSPSSSPPSPRYHLRDRKVPKSPTRPTARQRVTSRASTTSLSPRRANKTRSSTSKNATKNTGKINVSPSRPALRRSARRAGMRL